MKIEWLGHACFLITSQDGVRVLTDPFDEKVGYPLPEVAADIVTISHHHGDHNNTSVVKGEFTVFDSPGSFREKGIDILGLATFHDEEMGSRRGKNTIFRMTVDGLHVLHCGDLGHLLSPDQVAALHPVDILIVPVGGHFTIDGQQAVETIHALQPAVTIPMHFKTQVINFPIQPVDAFLEQAGGGRRVGSTVIELDPQLLRDMGGVVVLDYPT